MIFAYNNARNFVLNGVYAMVYLFLYNVIYIKSDFKKLKELSNAKLILIGSPYCLKHLNVENRLNFETIHQISRDFHQTDYDEIHNIVTQYVENYGAQDIRLFTNEDSAQIVCAQLREKFSIPGLHVDRIIPFVNKVISKNRLGDVVRMPRFTPFDKKAYLNDKEAYLNTVIGKIGGFPMFAKPIDLVSSVETHFIPDLKALQKVADRAINHSYEFEIDEFIEGDLFHCDAMIIDGEVKFFMIGKCSFALARFFEGKPVGSIPIINKKMFDELQAFCEKVFKKLDSPDGAYHMEAFLNKKDQQFVFLEIGARTGGALISRVYKKVFDINIEEVNYLIQMGLIKEVKTATPTVFAGFLNFPTIKGTCLDIIKPPMNIQSEFIEFVSPNEEMRQAENLLDIACSIIFWDESYEKVESEFEFLKNYNPLKVFPPQKMVSTVE